MIDPERRGPSPRTLSWVERQVGPGWRVARVRRLMGGISSAVHAITLRNRDAARALVLRRWVGEWATSDPAVGHGLVVAEQRALDALAPSTVPAPELIAGDPAGEDTDHACVLMTRLPGKVHLAPRDPASWLRAQAQVLPVIHSLHADVRVSAPPSFSRWKPPARTRRPDIWRAARAALHAPPPPTDLVFRHGDFQHFNLLWSRERLTGVVDWTFPRIGAPDLDVGHCRLNLAALFSAEWAEQFRGCYESVAGRTVDPWWDLAALLSFGDDWPDFIPTQVHGLIPVDTAGMIERVEELVAITLGRLGA